MKFTFWIAAFFTAGVTAVILAISIAHSSAEAASPVSSTGTKAFDVSFCDDATCVEIKPNGDVKLPKGMSERSAILLVAKIAVANEIAGEKQLQELALQYTEHLKGDIDVAKEMRRALNSRCVSARREYGQELNPREVQGGRRGPERSTTIASLSLKYWSSPSEAGLAVNRRRTSVEQQNASNRAIGAEDGSGQTVVKQPFEPEGSYIPSGEKE